MISVLCWTLLLLTGALGEEAREDNTNVQVEGGDGETQATPDQPDKSFAEEGPLFLTPLIEKCSYEEAKAKSKVKLFETMGVQAYSGYITINKSINLFFLFVEGQMNHSSEPLLLWTQGGPGLSALFGQFLQNGPISIDEYGNTTKRYKTLQKNMSVIYLDLPVGAGFSFTQDNASYARTLEDIIFSVREFLDQFLQLFSYYENRDFYLGGESYGARYSVAVAHWMLSNTKNLSLSLKGVISGSGFLGPVLQIAESSSFLYQMSMVNASGRDTFKAQFDMMEKLAANTSTIQQALYFLFSTIFTNPTAPTLFQKLTSFNDHASPLFTERPMIMYVCISILNSTLVRKNLHVGNIPFQYNNPLLLGSLLPDWLRDISYMVEHVLNKSRMLFYMGQLDTLFPAVNQKTYLATLNWTHAKEYRKTDRELWRKPDSTYGAHGFIKKVQSFTEALVLGMSHYGSAEKPDEVYYLITEFVASSSLSANAEQILEKPEIS